MPDYMSKRSKEEKDKSARAVAKTIFSTTPTHGKPGSWGDKEPGTFEEEALEPEIDRQVEADKVMQRILTVDPNTVIIEPELEIVAVVEEEAIPEMIKEVLEETPAGVADLMELRGQTEPPEITTSDSTETPVEAKLEPCKPMVGDLDELAEALPEELLLIPTIITEEIIEQPVEAELEPSEEKMTLEELAGITAAKKAEITALRAKLAELTEDSADNPS